MTDEITNETQADPNLPSTSANKSIHVTLKTIEGKIVSFEHEIKVDVEADIAEVKAKIEKLIKKLHAQPEVAPGAENAPSPKITL